MGRKFRFTCRSAYNRKINFFSVYTVWCSERALYEHKVAVKVDWHGQLESGIVSEGKQKRRQ